MVLNYVLGAALDDAAPAAAAAAVLVRPTTGALAGAAAALAAGAGTAAFLAAAAFFSRPAAFLTAEAATFLAAFNSIGPFSPNHLAAARTRISASNNNCFKALCSSVEMTPLLSGAAGASPLAFCSAS